MPSKVQKNIAMLRKQKGLTQNQMADALHITRTNYAYNETRASRLDPHFIDQVAHILEVSSAALIYGFEERMPMRLHDVPPPPIKRPPAFMATHREQKMIEMMRCIPKEMQAKFFNDITEEYKKSRNE